MKFSTFQLILLEILPSDQTRTGSLACLGVTFVGSSVSDGNLDAAFTAAGSTSRVAVVVVVMVVGLLVVVVVVVVVAVVRSTT